MIDRDIAASVQAAKGCWAARFLGADPSGVSPFAIHWQSMIQAKLRPNVLELGRLRGVTLGD
jgi:hypothetical protein